MDPPEIGPESLDPAWREIVSIVAKGDYVNMNRSWREVLLASYKDLTGVALWSVPVVWDQAGECAVSPESDMLVGFVLDPDETEVCVLDLFQCGAEVGRVAVWPGRVAYAVKGDSGLHLMYWARPKIRKRGRSTPRLRMIYAVLDARYRGAAIYCRKSPRLSVYDEHSEPWCVIDEDKPGIFSLLLAPLSRLQHLEEDAVATISRAYLGWRWRKDVLWNPHTELGQRRLALEADRVCEKFGAIKL